MDPIERLSDEQLRHLSADLEVQLEKGTALRPVLWLLVRARERAVNALGMFVDIDPTKTEDIRKLQNEVRIYYDMVASCQLLIARGREADSNISERDRDALQEVIMNMSEEDQRLYQLQQTGHE